MKQYIKRFVVFAVVLTLILGLMPGGSAQAAKKKTKTITVTTQEELVAALKKYKSSGSTVTIKIETTEKSTFTLNAKYSSDLIKIVVDAPNATFKSKATVSSITINEAKSVKEYASGNKITVNDEKLTFTAMPTASVEKLTIASETGTVKVVNNGGIEKVAVKSEVKVDLTQNGEVGRVYVGAAADISVSGTAEESLKVTVQKDAVGASVKSEVPVSVNAYGTVDLTLEKGAESSKVTVKEENAGVKLENKTEETVSVKDSDGKTQKVETGEELTSDNYVGKDGETETPVGETETEQPKEEEKKEEEKKDEKEEEKKDDTTTQTGGGSVGGGSEGGYSGGDTTTTNVAQTRLQSALDSAEKGYENAVKMTANVTLTKELTIPSGVCLRMNGYTLNASSCKINFEPDAAINVEPESKLYVGAKNIILGDDGTGFCYGQIGLYPGCEFKYGDALFTAENKDGDDGWTGWISMEKRWESFRDEWDSSKNFDYIMTDIAIWVEGQRINITGSNNLGADDLPKVFGDNACWTGEEWPIEKQGDKVTVVRTAVQPNVRYDTQEITFAGHNGALIDHVNTVEDWINAYLNPGLTWSAQAAEADGKKAPTGITYADTEDGRVVTITNQTTTIKKGIWVQRGSTLIGKDFVVDFRENQKVSLQERSKFFGQENYDPQSITVFGEGYDEEGCHYNGGTLELTGITSAVTSNLYPGEQKLLDVRGNGSVLKWKGKVYKVESSDKKFIEENRAAFQYKCYNQEKGYYSFLVLTWEGDFAIKGSEDGTNFVEVFQHPVGGDLVPATEQITVKDSDQLLSFANSTSKWAAEEFWNGANNIALDRYSEYAKDYLHFFEATLISDKDADPAYKNKKPLVVSPVENVGEDGNTYREDYVVCGTSLKVDSDTKVELENKAEIRIERGSSLEVASVSEGTDKSGQLILGCGFKKDALGNFELDGENNKIVETSRVTVDWGGKLIIDGMVFQCPNHANDWDRGLPGVALDVIGYGSNDGLIVRLQVGEDAIITKKNGSVPTVDEFNTWLTKNKLFFEINYAEPLADHYFDENGERTAEPESEGDRVYREMIASWHCTPYVKLGDVNAFLFRENESYNKLVSGTVTGANNEFHVKNEWELLDVWAQIDQFDNTGEGGKGWKVYIEPDNDQNELCVNGNLGDSWTIIVPEGKTLKINPHNALSGNVTVASGGAIEIIGSKDEEQAHLYTQAGATIEVFGTINVRKGEGEDAEIGRGQGHFCSHFGGKVIIRDGGCLNLNGGIFDCAYVDENTFIVEDGGKVIGKAPGCVKLWMSRTFVENNGTYEQLQTAASTLQGKENVFADVEATKEEICFE